MQIQKNLRQSIQRCHERRLEKLSKVNAKASSNARTLNPEKNFVPSNLKAIQILSSQNQLNTRTLPFNRNSVCSFTSKKQANSNLQSEKVLLLEEVNLNRTRLEQAKKDIQKFEIHLRYLQSELVQQERKNQLLIKRNRQLESQLQNIDKKFQQQKKANEKNKIQEIQHQILIQEIRGELVFEKQKFSLMQFQKKEVQIKNQGQLVEINSLRQKNRTLGQDLLLLKQQHQQNMQIINIKLESQTQKLITKEKSYSELLSKYQQIQKNYNKFQIQWTDLRSQKESYQNKILQLENEIILTKNQLQSTKTSKIKQDYEICVLQAKMSELEILISQYQKTNTKKETEKEEIIKKWRQTKILKDLNPDNLYCCKSELRLKLIELFLEYAVNSEASIDPLSGIQPCLYFYLKNLIERAAAKHNASVFSLSCSFNKLLGSYQQIAKMSQNQISNFIQQQDEASSREQNMNQQQLLARMQQQVINMSSSREDNKPDVSELKQNFQAVKLINEQLFNEVSTKQQVIKQLGDRLRFFQNYAGVIEHLKGNIESLCKELKNCSPKIGAILVNIRSLLGI